MIAAKYGRIVNIASVAGKEGNAGMAAYRCAGGGVEGRPPPVRSRVCLSPLPPPLLSASKAAVIGLTKVIGKDYAEAGGEGGGAVGVAAADAAALSLAPHYFSQTSRATPSRRPWSARRWSTRCPRSRSST